MGTIDLTGQRFGKLVVVAKDEARSKEKKRSFWFCDCDCGTKNKSIYASHLRRGAIVSCGCHGKSVGHQGLEDITGKRFGRLIAIENVEKPSHIKGKSTYWKCKCDCGKTVIVRTADLKNGKTQSCGCYNREIASNRAIDLTGQRFGKLTVISRDMSIPAGVYRVSWICKCDCGETVSVYGAYLRNGDTKSCGCLNKEDLTGKRYGKLTVECFYETIDHRRFWKCRCDCGEIVVTSTERLNGGDIQSCGCIRADDLQDQRFGMLTVLYRDKSIPIGEPVHWICKCDCGNIKSIAAGSLKSGSTTSCGCYQKFGPYKGGSRGVKLIATDGTEVYLKENLIGKRFGRLEVVGFVGMRQSGVIRKSVWRCKCDCGKEGDYVRDNLINGYITSCGCYKAEKNRERGLKDISNQRFGYWTAIELDETRTTLYGKYQYWICKCDCGTIRSIVGSTLRNGMSLSCGCMNIPKLEYYVANYLYENEYNYKTQVKFPDLKGVGNKNLSYDFGIYDKNDKLLMLIECQGIQHYEPVDIFGGDNRFEIQNMHDELKRDYAKSINIPLLEIPYTMSEKDIGKVLTSKL